MELESNAEIDKPGHHHCRRHLSPLSIVSIARCPSRGPSEKLTTMEESYHLIIPLPLPKASTFRAPVVKG
uniref:Uncharacterized protein n=1 Tax=Knipowitschia caucasica TaxID=637954 RepID=A0AAV2JU81_KNICA